MVPEQHVLESLRAYRQRLSLALQAAQMCVFEVDIPGQRYTFFENAEAIYGKSGQQILRDLEPFSRLSPPEYQAAVSAYFSHPGDAEAIGAAFQEIYAGRPASYFARMRAGNTAFTWCKIDVTPIMENGVPVRMVGVVSNLDSMFRTTEQYRIQAELDLLTGLANRHGLQNRLEAALTAGKGALRLLLLADLDELKAINDHRGHLAGDEALLAFSSALTAHFPEAEVIGRWGGDEFLLLLPPLEEAALLDRLRPFFSGLCEEFSVTGSFGGTYLSAGMAALEPAFRRADQALYDAKHRKPAFSMAPAEFCTCQEAIPGF